VALLGRGEAALRRQAELVERCELRRLVDAALYLVLLLERAALRRDQAKDDAFPPLRQETERFEPAGAVGIVLKEIAVDVELAEEGLGNRLVAARRDPGRAEIAAADMHGDGEVGGAVRDGAVDGAGVAFRQPADVVAAFRGQGALLFRAEISPYGIIELQV